MDTIRTNAMEEKAIACRTLVLLLNTLHGGLQAYLSAISQTLPPLCTSSFDDIQMSALACMPDLLIAISETLQEPTAVDTYRHTFLYLVDILLSFIADEPDIELLFPALQTLYYCILKSVLHRGRPIPIMQGAEVARIVEVLHDALKVSFERRAIRSADVEREDWDEEEVEEYKEIEENENQAHYWIASILGELLNGHSEFALPLIHEILLSDMMDCCDPSRTAGDRLLALLVMEKIVEYCGKEAYIYYPQFIPIFRREIHASNPTIREVAAQGLGMAAEFGGDLLWEVAEQCVKELEDTLDDPVSRESCYSDANGLDVIAIGKLCLYCEKSIGSVDRHFLFWLNHLPLSDGEQMEACVLILCRLLDKGDEMLLGKEQQNLSKILEVLCQAVGCVGNAGVEQQALHMIKSIQMHSSPDLFNALWNVLGERAGLVQQKLQSI